MPYSRPGDRCNGCRDFLLLLTLQSDPQQSFDFCLLLFAFQRFQDVGICPVV